MNAKWISVKLCTYCYVRCWIPWAVRSEGANRARHEHPQIVLFRQLDDVVNTFNVHPETPRTIQIRQFLRHSKLSILNNVPFLRLAAHELPDGKRYILLPDGAQQCREMNDPIDAMIDNNLL